MFVVEDDWNDGQGRRWPSVEAEVMTGNMFVVLIYLERRQNARERGFVQ